MKRGEIWLAQVGHKRRPVLVMTRSQVLDVRTLVTVAEITISARGLAAEVALDDVTDSGIDQGSVINCDGLHTIPQTMLTKLVGTADSATMTRVCNAVSYALGC